MSDPEAILVKSFAPAFWTMSPGEYGETYKDALELTPPEVCAIAVIGRMDANDMPAAAIAAMDGLINVFTQVVTFMARSIDCNGFKRRQSRTTHLLRYT
jgi:hypothetical protein